MDSTTEVIKKKRGRKKKSEIENNNISYVVETVEEQPKIPKKRGRKPKGGKIIDKPTVDINEKVTITNVILHLKCFLSDIQQPSTLYNPHTYNPIAPPVVLAYNPQNNAPQYYNSDNDKLDNLQPAYQKQEEFTCSLCKNKEPVNITPKNNDDQVDMKDINTKLKQIKLQLYRNSNPDKKAACFWCTYDYDNPSCYIPKYEHDGELCGYGSFCRPECAVAYLLKENIDDSTKFERYHLLNKIYAKVYDFKKNVKPAPDPHFLLDKFYGNLSIQEYRKLLNTEHMLLVVEKPMTRILPELHENNDDIDSINIHKVQSSKQTGIYKVKRQSEKQKGPTKNEIMKENFGF